MSITDKIDFSLPRDVGEIAIAFNHREEQGLSPDLNRALLQFDREFVMTNDALRTAAGELRDAAERAMSAYSDLALNPLGVIQGRGQTVDNLIARREQVRSDRAVLVSLAEKSLAMQS